MERTIRIFLNTPHRPNWNELREALAQMNIGDTLTMVTSDWPYVHSAQQAVWKYTEHSRARESGWRFATSSTSKTLIVEKVEHREL